MGVGINLEENGSGEVTFSVGFENALTIENPQLLNLIDISDLEAGGWHVIEAESADDNLETLTVTKSFLHESQIQQLLNEISPGAFAIDIQRSENEILISGELDMVTFKDNLFANSNIDTSNLRSEASQIVISTQIGDNSSQSKRAPLTSNETIDFNHTLLLQQNNIQTSENQSQIWGWVFLILGLFILTSFIIWLYQKRQKNYSGFKASAKLSSPRKF